MALEKATITNTDTGDRVTVMFNPEEYTVNRANTFAEIGVPGLRSPLLQFVHGALQTLDMELLVDTLETHGPGAGAGSDVRDVTRRVTDLLNINPETHAPPVALFTWGQLNFRCVLAKVTQRFILFRPDGVPLRARLTVSFSEYTNAEFESKETKRETGDYSKSYVVTQGETVSDVAAKVYKNAELWRPIALHNGLDDPRVLAAGTHLLVPTLPYRDPETGEVTA
jgi:nucleoid-associated protein YgaU